MGARRGNVGAQVLANPEASLLSNPPPTNERPLGVVCAMPEEVEHLAVVLVDDRSSECGGFRFRAGLLDGRAVVLAEGGIGKVAGALVTALLLERYGCRALVLSGVAGGLDPALGIGDVVVAERLIQHDYGAVTRGRIKNFRPGVAPLGEAREIVDYRLGEALRGALGEALSGYVLPALPAGVAGGRQPSLGFGTVLTGDQFVNCEDTRGDLFDRFSAQAVDMESAALAQVAERYGAPWIVVRALSDLAGSESHLDFPAFVSATAETAAGVVRRVLPVL